ncbi:Dabb family protein [Calycomorphotria hydatis]|uniref:Stress responsive A/B Barrel Domain protein n=1 Tax=Calycomorphotria hydatis TaxID=2528027 RepID=A0A517T7H1_9PLAN|nr:Dabb family protein [Calycomorphotria hydatis]QDT64326.1 Stress responsive A/B Barrel Domain protein [Calycomorphotria hydatis]
MLTHDVFFTLKDSSPAACEALVGYCNEFLKDEPGIVFFAAGIREESLSREVNDTDFHVGLHVAFDTKENHDAYQVAPRHMEFIEAGKDNWASVRVFDTTCG